MKALGFILLGLALGAVGMRIYIGGGFGGSSTLQVQTLRDTIVINGKRDTIIINAKKDTIIIHAGLADCDSVPPPAGCPPKITDTILIP